MKKKAHGKLQLHRETVRALTMSQQELQEVTGGTFTSTTMNSWTGCDPLGASCIACPQV